uniref:Putative secreted protein n=1 Tax=Xenopsylla cheopis TaxID=163159 RepID=A0A6M2DUB8_XENCH
MKRQKVISCNLKTLILLPCLLCRQCCSIHKLCLWLITDKPALIHRIYLNVQELVSNPNLLNLFSLNQNGKLVKRNRQRLWKRLI